MYKNILVPVLLDDSRNTDQSLAAAKALASKDANLTLLHILEAVPLYVADFIPPETIHQNKDEMRRLLDEKAKGLENCRTILLEGRAGPSICQYADDNAADLIVIASHQPAFSDILLGSVAQHVVRHAHCAVHVIR